METKSIEEIKKSYADEIHRLAELEQKINAQYKSEYEFLKSQEDKLLNEYNTQMQKISIGIERLRGAYTAIVDFEEGKAPTLVENGMLKDFKVEDGETEPETNDVIGVDESAVAESVVKQVSENKEQEPTEELAQLHKNTGSEISKELQEKAHELVKEAKEKGKITKYEDFAETDLGKETALTPDEVKALESVMNNKKDSRPDEADIKETETTNKVKEEDVPDYLKEEYGLNKK